MTDSSNFVIIGTMSGSSVIIKDLADSSKLINKMRIGKNEDGFLRLSLFESLFLIERGILSLSGDNIVDKDMIYQEGLKSDRYFRDRYRTYCDLRERGFTVIVCDDCFMYKRGKEDNKQYRKCFVVNAYDNNSIFDILDMIKDKDNCQTVSILNEFYTPIYYDVSLFNSKGNWLNESLNERMTGIINGNECLVDLKYRQLLLENGFGKDGLDFIVLNMVEMLYLISNNHLIVEMDGEIYSFNELFNYCCKIQSDFRSNYEIYSAVRSFGYVIKDDMSTGADYKVFSEIYNSEHNYKESYLLYILADNYGTYWKKIVGACRLSNSLRKRVLLAIADKFGIKMIKINWKSP